jgi:hypothetical protein
MTRLTYQQKQEAAELRGHYRSRDKAKAAAQELANLTGREAYSVVVAANNAQGFSYRVQYTPGQHWGAIDYAATPITPSAKPTAYTIAATLTVTADTPADATRIITEALEAAGITIG